MCSQVAYMHGSVHISCKITIFFPRFFSYGAQEKELLDANTSVVNHLAHPKFFCWVTSGHQELHSLT